MDAVPLFPGGGPQAIGRRVIVSDRLDHDAATFLCAQLMTLDGESDEPVDLLISSDGGPIGCLLPIIDTIATMRAPVNTRATGVATGTAGSLVALGSGNRAMAAHALLSIRLVARRAEPGLAVEDLDRIVAEQSHQRTTLAQLLSARTGATVDTIAAELDAGELHPPDDALGLGLVDPPRDRLAATD